MLKGMFKKTVTTSGLGHWPRRWLMEVFFFLIGKYAAEVGIGLCKTDWIIRLTFVPFFFFTLYKSYKKNTV